MSSYLGMWIHFRPNIYMSFGLQISATQLLILRISIFRILWDPKFQDFQTGPGPSLGWAWARPGLCWAEVGPWARKENFPRSSTLLSFRCRTTKICGTFGTHIIIYYCGFQNVRVYEKHKIGSELSNDLLLAHTQRGWSHMPEDRFQTPPGTNIHCKQRNNDRPMLPCCMPVGCLSQSNSLLLCLNADGNAWWWKVQCNFSYNVNFWHIW